MGISAFIGQEICYIIDEWSSRFSGESLGESAIFLLVHKRGIEMALTPYKFPQ